MAELAFPGPSPLNPALYGQTTKNKAPEPGKGGKTGAVKKKKGFASLFEKAVLGNVKELPQSEDSIHELLDEVHNAGDALSKRPFPPEIKAYKEAVRNFVHHVVENSFDTEEQMSGTNILKRKKFTLVQVIDSKLENLAAVILRGQAGQLDILSRLDEINGLLVDLKQ